MEGYQASSRSDDEEGSRPVPSSVSEARSKHSSSTNVPDDSITGVTSIFAWSCLRHSSQARALVDVLASCHAKDRWFSMKVTRPITRRMANHHAQVPGPITRRNGESSRQLDDTFTQSDEQLPSCRPEDPSRPLPPLGTLEIGSRRPMEVSRRTPEVSIVTPSMETHRARDDGPARLGKIGRPDGGCRSSCARDVVPGRRRQDRTGVGCSGLVMFDAEVALARSSSRRLSSMKPKVASCATSGGSQSGWPGRTTGRGGPARRRRP